MEQWSGRARELTHSASYGSLARFRDTKRLVAIGDNTIVGASGEISDLQAIEHMFEKMSVKEYQYNDGHVLSPENVFEYLGQIMYARRSKFNPLWNYLVVGGRKDSKNFLGFVDLRGTTFEASTIATGYGAYIAQPLLRKAVEGKEDTLTEEDAKTIVESAMKVLYYRDARSLNKVCWYIVSNSLKMIIGTITDAGVKISEPYALETDWQVGAMVKGYGSG